MSFVLSGPRAHQSSVSNFTYVNQSLKSRGSSGPLLQSINYFDDGRIPICFRFPILSIPQSTDLLQLLIAFDILKGSPLGKRTVMPLLSSAKVLPTPTSAIPKNRHFHYQMDESVWVPDSVFTHHHGYCFQTTSLLQLWILMTTKTGQDKTLSY